MKTYLQITGVVFLLLAALAFFIIYEHWGGSEAKTHFVVIHTAIGLCFAALAVWAFRLGRRPNNPA